MHTWVRGADRLQSILLPPRNYDGVSTFQEFFGEAAADARPSPGHQNSIAHAFFPTQRSQRDPNLRGETRRLISSFPRIAHPLSPLRGDGVEIIAPCGNLAIGKLEYTHHAQRNDRVSFAVQEPIDTLGKNSIALDRNR